MRRTPVIAFAALALAAGAIALRRSPNTAPDRLVLEGDPERAGGASLPNSAEPERARSARDALITSKSSDLAARVQSLLADWRAEADPVRRGRRLDELLALLTDANVGEIVRSLTDEQLATPFGELALKRWAAVERVAAATWLFARPAPDELQAGLVGYGWLAEDRDRLHAFLDSMPESAWRLHLINAATNDALLVHDGAEAVALLARLPPAAQRDQMLGWAVTEWARKDPATVTEWVARIPDQNLQPALFGAAVVGCARQAPAMAADLLVSSGLAEQADQTALVSVMNIWSQRDPAAAADWVRRELRGSAQLAAVRSVVAHWSLTDATALRSWVDALADGALRDQARRSLRRAEAASRGVELSDTP